jgi:hypothetical protein
LLSHINARPETRHDRTIRQIQLILLAISVPLLFLPQARFLETNTTRLRKEMRLVSRARKTPDKPLTPVIENYSRLTTEASQLQVEFTPNNQIQIVVFVGAPVLRDR